MTGVRHVVTLTFNDETAQQQIDRIVAVLRTLPDAIPEIEAYSVGQDLGLAPGNAALAIVADFASVADYETYRDHPAHQAVIVDEIRPHVTGRSAVQMER